MSCLYSPTRALPQTCRARLSPFPTHEIQGVSYTHMMPRDSRQHGRAGPTFCATERRGGRAKRGGRVRGLRCSALGPSCPTEGRETFPLTRASKTHVLRVSGKVEGQESRGVTENQGVSPSPFYAPAAFSGCIVGINPVLLDHDPSCTSSVGHRRLFCLPTSQSSQPKQPSHGHSPPNMSCNPACHPTVGSAPHTLPISNAYYCCKCQYGPMLYTLHPACIMCGTAACSYCSPATIHAQLEHTRQRAQSVQAGPRDPYGSTRGLDSHSDASMMLRYLHDESSVSERLSNGRVQRSLTDLEENLDSLLQQYGYNMRNAGQKL
ncbi:hypothetical protein B0J12DRAFT_164462 [Macrophomina phaseolina]|uniref:Uncharacterized protein n=1 Tax=Macrophomina phaseolina TaxID=35725 RepID=A0ABQ8GV42_9PEZI|nr:hypothetical protein B0J12DRAFT_164462 [Macrophomina phaseolina]